MIKNNKILNFSSVIGQYTSDALDNLLAAINTAVNPGKSWTNLVPGKAVLPIGSARSYYCKVLFSGTPIYKNGTDFYKYVAYFSTGSAIALSYSNDGEAWTNDVLLTGVIGGASHGCPILVGGMIYLYYWNSSLLYTPATIRQAVINPAINCNNAISDQPLTGNYVNGISGGGNLRAGCYGFNQMFYNASPTNEADKPYSYRWCAIQNGTDGSQEGILFGVSDDGINFSQISIGGNFQFEVIQRGTGLAWDTWVGEMTVWRDAVGKWFCYYSGGVGTGAGADSNFADGLGYAESNDGINWTKYSGNPVMFKTFSEQSSKRLYTPWVIKETYGWRMYFTAKGSYGSNNYVTNKANILYYGKGS